LAGVEKNSRKIIQLSPLWKNNFKRCFNERPQGEKKSILGFAEKLLPKPKRERQWSYVFKTRHSQ
jgi:hypothetical protein